ncbi:MAG: N-acetyl-gamma-glutamyl-phosphate reductase [Eubacteriaceae bacterium]|nr:N-acetyl-gamma-glutamyl-phosphate reductase [Eubacteriaceae bacterium]MDD4507932.1 N-acetyl-gamma-glutamyl-phosphate reductase [Eubacteriaceae bacterium]
MINVAIIGATGYAGQELVRLLYRHPDVNLISVGSRSYSGQPLQDVYPLYNKISNILCEKDDIQDLSKRADVIFLALPHGIASKKVTSRILEDTKIIDLGADFRLKDLSIYKEWYQVDHWGKDILKEAVYGLCELHREKIKDARLLANPGCYTTCSILTLAPLIVNHVIDLSSIIIDAKSGVTGAGRNGQLPFMYCECNESVKAYKVACHRHTPEIEQELAALCDQDIRLLFTPNLVPMNRGILSVCYADLLKDIDEGTLRQMYREYYKNEYFIRLTEDKLPETRWVKGSNFCDIGLKIDPRTKKVIAIGAIDNLIKGAAGQAIQNMNLMFGLDEKTGIDLVTDFPV